MVWLGIRVMLSSWKFMSDTTIFNINLGNNVTFYLALTTYLLRLSLQCLFNKLPCHQSDFLLQIGTRSVNYRVRHLNLQFIPVNVIIYRCIWDKALWYGKSCQNWEYFQFLKVLATSAQNAKNRIYWNFANICKFAKHIASKTTLGVKVHLYYAIWMRMSKYNTLEAIWPQKSIKIWC